MTSSQSSSFRKWSRRSSFSHILFPAFLILSFDRKTFVTSRILTSIILTSILYYKLFDPYYCERKNGLICEYIIYSRVLYSRVYMCLARHHRMFHGDLLSLAQRRTRFFKLDLEFSGLKGRLQKNDCSLSGGACA